MSPRGIIDKISINPERHRRGLGRRLILRAHRDGPDYTWRTSGQSSDAQKFFPSWPLLLHRTMAHEHVVAGIATALQVGALTAAAVAIEARKAATQKSLRRSNGQIPKLVIVR